MTDIPIVDTDPGTHARRIALLRAMTAAERLARALDLTAVTRDLAWQGAMRHSEPRGSAAVVDRFLRQLYGPAFAEWVASRRSAAAHE